MSHTFCLVLQDYTSKRGNFGLLHLHVVTPRPKYACSTGTIWLKSMFHQYELFLRNYTLQVRNMAVHGNLLHFIGENCLFYHQGSHIKVKVYSYVRSISFIYSCMCYTGHNKHKVNI